MSCWIDGYGKAALIWADATIEVGRTRHPGRGCRMGARSTEKRRPLPEKDGQQYSQTQREKPQRGRWRSYLSNPSQPASHKSRIEDEPAGVAALKQKEGQCGRG